MKHAYLFCLLGLLLLGRAGYAQAPDGARLQLNQIFANLDKTQVPSAYLEEYGEQFLGLHPYIGVLTDSNRTDMEAFRYLRATIFSARTTGTDTLPGITELNRRLDARGQGADGAPNPLAVQYMSYHRIRPDALQNNLLAVQNDQVSDVPGRAQSPYAAATLFAAAPLYRVSRTGTVSLVFARNLYFTNNPSLSVQGLYLDFDDGRGYVRAYWNQPAAATYGSTGHKHIRVKITYQPAPVFKSEATTSRPGPSGTFSLESHFDVEVLQVATATAARYGSQDDITYPIAPTSAHSGATVSVRYGRGHTSMTKPFIIVEQYNLASIFADKAPDLLACDNDNNTIKSFLDKIDLVDFDGNRGNFNDVLHNSAQYDIVYIDFTKNTDDIRRNAVLFQEVVRWVNGLKAQAGSTTPNVVMGQSMGGLISRYGLAQMVRLPADPDPTTGRNRNNPETRLLVLHDSPQRGAYSPVGTQSLARALEVPFIFGWSVASFSATARATLAVLNEPASQQLSILNAYNSHGDIRPDPFLDGQYRQVISFSPTDPV